MMGFWDQVQSRPTLRIFEKIRAGELRFLATLRTAAALVGSELRTAVAEYVGTGRKLTTTAALIASRLGTPIFYLDAGLVGKLQHSAALMASVLRVALFDAALIACGKLRHSAALTASVLRVALFQAYTGTNTQRQLRFSAALKSSVLA